METLTTIRRIGYVATVAALIFGFLIIYRETNQLIYSFGAALVAALMVWGTFIIMRWLAQVFLK